MAKKGKHRANQADATSAPVSEAPSGAEETAEVAQSAQEAPKPDAAQKPTESKSSMTASNRSGITLRISGNTVKDGESVELTRAQLKSFELSAFGYQMIKRKKVLVS